MERRGSSRENHPLTRGARDGDTLQFIRYVSWVAERGGKIILEVQPPLLRLLEKFANVEKVIARGEPLPEFSLHCPLMSLPRIFQTNLENIPPLVSTVFTYHKSNLQVDKTKLNVAIVWAGNIDHQKDRDRSVTLEMFESLASDRVQLYSLQKGPAEQQLREASHASRIINLSAHLNDFSDTAAVLAEMICSFQ